MANDKRNDRVVFKPVEGVAPDWLCNACAWTTCSERQPKRCPKCGAFGLERLSLGASGETSERVAEALRRIMRDAAIIGRGSPAKGHRRRRQIEREAKVCGEAAARCLRAFMELPETAAAALLERPAEADGGADA